MQAQGHDVIHMEVGEPDFPTPAPINELALESLRSGQTKYTNAAGDEQLRQAIANYYQEDYGISIGSNRIFVTAGGSGALLLAMAMLVNPGDGWLMTDPGYPCNKNFLPAFNGVAQTVEVNAGCGYQFDGAMVRDSWQANTRGVLLASPSNPTGATIEKETLRDVLGVVSQKKGTLIVDEIYHGLDYDTDDKWSALELGEDVIVVNSFSKYFGMTGWRLGWMVVPETATAALEKLAQNLFICASSVAQKAAIAAFSTESRLIMEAQREEFRRRRDFLVPALQNCGFDIELPPAGAFYIYARLPGHLPDSEEFASGLLERHFVAITPGTDFGKYESSRHVRVSYAQSLPRLEEAVVRLKRALC